MTVSIQKSGAIAHVVVDNPPVNAISAAVRAGLLDAVRSLDADPGVTAVVLSCAGRTFMAGADVSEFNRPPVEPHLNDLVAAIEGSAKPWVAAIHGSALGGGLEIALGCAWRVAVASAQFGLPEVNLGIIPGAGGTVRTPRLVGVPVAVDLITGGKPVKAAQALELGLIDAIIEGDPAAAAEAWLARAGARPVALIARPVADPGAEFWDKALMAAKKAGRGNTGPEEALASIRRGVELPVAEALAAERAAIMRLRVSPQAAALRSIFFAERGATRPAELKGVEPRPLTKVGVIGGGTMGAGIAVAMRAAGLPVHMIERDAEAVARGVANVTKTIDADLASGRLTQAQRDARLAGFSASDAYADLADCDLVIEAVFEDLAVKRAVFAELVKVCSADAVLATNTSYLDPVQIFEGLPGQERFIGLHFFSPANVMKLLEIVPTPATSDAVLATGFELARRAGKMPVRAGICDGFIGNRLLKQTRTQGERLLLAGASPVEVDAALRAFGFAMGPFQVQDLAGLDIGAMQRQAARARGETPFAPVADRVYAAGRLGRKTGAGWYDYDAAGKAAPELSPVVIEAIEAARAEAGSAPGTISPEDIVAAVLYPMINDSARILAEGVALREGDIDLVKVHGYGFPRYRGGPVQYGRAIGFDTVVAGLEALAARGLADGPSEELRAWAAGGTKG